MIDPYANNEGSGARFEPRSPIELRRFFRYMIKGGCGRCLSAPRMPGGDPPSSLPPSVMFGHTASDALEAGATRHLHIARSFRRRIDYRHLSRSVADSESFVRNMLGRFPLLGPPTSLIPALLRINCPLSRFGWCPPGVPSSPWIGFHGRAVGVPFTSW